MGVKNTASIPDFTGKAEDNPKRWLLKLESYATLHNLTDEQKRAKFIISLNGAAGDWYELYTAEGTHTTTETYEAFQTEFAVVDDVWNNMCTLDNCRQKVNESVDDFTTAIKVMYFKSKTPKTEQATHYTLRLRPEIMCYVAEKKPSSLKEAYEFAKTSESMKKLKNAVTERATRENLIADLQDCKQHHERPNRDDSPNQLHTNPEIASANWQRKDRQVEVLRFNLLLILKI